MAADRVVLVTGASRGIGRATAAAFARAGYDAAINCRADSAGLSETAELALRHGARVLPVMADVSDFDAARDMFDRVERELGAVSALVNNAGVSRRALFTDTGPDDWRRVMDVNFMSVLNCCRLAAPGMVRRGRGAIINVSSVWGERGASCEAVYSASKGAVGAFSRALGKELAPSGITVNAVAPGVIDTAMNAGLTAPERAALTDAIPAGRFGAPEEVAELCVFLAGAGYITGQVITVDGGFA
ncbi:MAG: 3-oxoacyl-ACP reductase FabG [Clostridiales bacterium]|jgi:3-oxoacyl-[acyl-carrier protein] reductase|nr:3-oxoacyl-ACP reductase FabG [Clostridiales bacterium]